MKFKKPKLNSKGFSHVEMIIALVVIVAIAGVGVFVYKHHQDNKSMSSMGTDTAKPILGSSVNGESINIAGKSLGSIVPSASAMNLSHITGGPTPSWNIYGCKTAVTTSKGVYWQITGFFWKPANSYGFSELMDITWNPTKKKTVLTPDIASDTYLYGLVSEIQINVPALELATNIILFDERNNVGKVVPTVDITNAFSIAELKYIVDC